MYIYKNTPTRGYGVNLENALMYYQRHITNRMILDRLYQTVTDFMARWQITEEIVIAERKAEFFYKRGSFTAKEMARVTKEAREDAYAADLSEYLKF